MCKHAVLVLAESERSCAQTSMRMLDEVLTCAFSSRHASPEGMFAKPMISARCKSFSPSLCVESYLITVTSAHY